MIKAACSWRQNRQKNGARQKARKETRAHTFSDYEKRGKARICNGEKNTVSSISCVGKSEQLHVERVRHYVSVLSCSVASDSVTLWTVARQAPLSVGFSRQENWSGLPCPPPGDLPHPGNIRRYAKINSKWFKDISKTWSRKSPRRKLRQYTLWQQSQQYFLDLFPQARATKINN